MNKYIFFPMALCAVNQIASSAATPPNIILIMCDDMGYSDLACYGGEIHTPNINYLAENGVRFSQFKNTGRSCPSRAALLTGHYQHEAGMGWMTAVDEHRPGYRGQITSSLPTIAEIFRDNGYATYMSGKWHVTVDGAFDTPNGSYPVQRGFEKYYGALSGGGSYYKPTPLYNGLKRVTDYPDDFYYTTAITDSAVSFIKNKPDKKPMFLYVAHYAPHRPLQAPADRVAACRERYKVGYDVLRKQRFDRMKQMGLISKEFSLPVYQKEFEGKRPAWSALSIKQKEEWINDMATYAAMVEIVDDGIGELIRATKEKGIYENTVFVFLSDNGATSEGGHIAQLLADLSNTPFRSYKRWCFQGGTSSPLILMYGGKKSAKGKGVICSEPGHIIDIMPTCLDMASIKYPQIFKGKKMKLEGVSLLSLLKTKESHPRDLYFEHQSSSAIISNGWKLVRYDSRDNWQLINLKKDPFELNDVSAKNPNRVKNLVHKWNNWAKRQHVFPLESRPWTERINYYKSLHPDQRGIE